MILALMALFCNYLGYSYMKVKQKLSQLCVSFKDAQFGLLSDSSAWLHLH